MRFAFEDSVDANSLKRKTHDLTPLILEVKGNSLDDGPGIRTVVFFKGCPLNCAWCHNPESKRTCVEISFDPRECVGCDTCIGVCPEGALDRRNEGFVDRARCTFCFECVEACPAEALTRVGRSWGIDELVAEVSKDIPFFRTSGGGVTLSGGEPTMFMDYCSNLVRALKAKDIHVILETCGHFDFERFARLVYPHVDEIYFDLKLFDSGEHREQCGADNLLILENFERLMGRALVGGTPVLPRIPLIPGITSVDENLEALAGFLLEAGAGRVALLQYNPLWLEKSVKIGGKNPLGELPDMRTWMPRSDVDAAKGIFEGFEVLS